MGLRGPGVPVLARTHRAPHTMQHTHVAHHCSFSFCIGLALNFALIFSMILCCVASPVLNPQSDQFPTVLFKMATLEVDVKMKVEDCVSGEEDSEIRRHVKCQKVEEIPDAATSKVADVVPALPTSCQTANDDDKPTTATEFEGCVVCNCKLKSTDPKGSFFKVTKEAAGFIKQDGTIVSKGPQRCCHWCYIAILESKLSWWRREFHGQPRKKGKD